MPKLWAGRFYMCCMLTGRGPRCLDLLCSLLAEQLLQCQGNRTHALHLHSTTCCSAAQCCCCRARCRQHAFSCASPWLLCPDLRCFCAWARNPTASEAGTRCQQPPARRWRHSPAGSDAGPNSRQAAAAHSRADARPAWGANLSRAAAARRTGACAGPAPGSQPGGRAPAAAASCCGACAGPGSESLPC